MMMHILIEYGVGSVYVSGHTGASDIQIQVKDNEYDGDNHGNDVDLYLNPNLSMYTSCCPLPTKVHPRPRRSRQPGHCSLSGSLT